MLPKISALSRKQEYYASKCRGMVLGQLQELGFDIAPLENITSARTWINAYENVIEPREKVQWLYKLAGHNI